MTCVNLWGVVIKHLARQRQQLFKAVFSTAQSQQALYVVQAVKLSYTLPTLANENHSVQHLFKSMFVITNLSIRCCDKLADTTLNLDD